jgi:hypothetical protein
MVPEAPIDKTDGERVAKGDGRFVLNAKDARWYQAYANVMPQRQPTGYQPDWLGYESIA